VLCPVAALGGIADGIAQLPADAVPSAAARADIPAAMLTLYRQAAGRCPGLPWPVLAGIGKVESNHNRPPGQVSRAGAQGPMQFLPATWTRYGADGNADGIADPMQPPDAIPAAADYLCGHHAATDLVTAVASYSCGGQALCLARAAAVGGYATRVLAWAARYSDPTQPAGPVATIAVQVALAQVGTRYVWGGESPGVGFDCSGLVQYAYTRAGLALPRTAQAQYDLGPHLDAHLDPRLDPAVDPAADPQPGDLLFFGGGPTQVTHVGIALGDGRMVDAPHTGAFVRVEPVAGFRPAFVGATRPAALTSPADAS
jgi:cell wall-associated NlpC family hydrolase